MSFVVDGETGRGGEAAWDSRLKTAQILPQSGISFGSEAPGKRLSRKNFAVLKKTLDFKNRI
ncbi:MAG: hypothetical protein IJS46_03345 [Kiritimatiellae bacterium]|nr:hypothetical protein [Kiritimatiellia bacterium]